MRIYDSFAAVYDVFMDNVPYEAWAAYLTDVFHREGIRDGLILDLGCGTGTMTRLLEQEGYDMIGVDSSEEMLQIACRAREESGMQGAASCILYLQQDMRDFELYGTVRAVISSCDSLNYILEEEELKQVFSLVNKYLDPGGLFLFDMNTPYKYEELLADHTFAETREECSFIWENSYDRSGQINEYGLTLFVKEENGLYRRFDEVHLQRSYQPETVIRLLKEAGMKLESVTDAYTGREPSAASERLLFMAREQFQADKTYVLP